MLGFAIVEMSNGKKKEVDVVPCHWLADGQCAWPSVKTPKELENAVRTGWQAMSTWHTYPARVLRMYGELTLIVSLT